MRILVTGANGFVGARLVKELAKENDVLALCRSKPDLPAKFVKGDLLDDKVISTLRRLTFDVVYHLAANTDESDMGMWDVNVEGTRRLLEACKNKNLTRFIFMSSSGVLGETNEPAKEDDPYNPLTHYEKSKAEAERLIMDYKLKHQIPYTILRAPIILGPNDYWQQIFKAAKSKYPMVGKGDNYFHVVYIDDVIQALTLAMQPIARNKIYHVAGPDPHTYRETYELIVSTLGAEMPERTIPVFAVKAAALAHELHSKAMKTKPRVTLMRSSIDRLVRNRIIDITKAEQQLGYQPKYTLKKALKKTVKELGV